MCSCQRGLECGHRLLVDPRTQFFGGWRAQDFVKEDLQDWVGDLLQAQRRLAHFADALAQRGGVLGAKVGMCKLNADFNS